MSEPKTLPIHYGFTSMLVGEVKVDDDLYEFLRTFKWFLSDTRRPRPPRTTFMFGTKAKHILLHKVVYMLHNVGDDQRMVMITDKVGFYNAYLGVPKLVVLNADPFDCRYDNIGPKVRELSLEAQKIATFIKHPPSTAFPNTYATDANASKGLKPIHESDTSTNPSNNEPTDNDESDKVNELLKTLKPEGDIE